MLLVYLARPTAFDPFGTPWNRFTIAIRSSGAIVAKYAVDFSNQSSKNQERKHQ